MPRGHERLFLLQFFYLCAAAFALAISFQCVYAADPELPKGVGPLPDLSKGAKAGAIVTAQHAHLYRPLLPPEIGSLVERGELAFEAVGAPREPARFADQQTAAGTVPMLTASGALQDVAGGKALVSPLFDPPTGTSGDLAQLAYKVLWNAASVMWRHNSFSAGFSVLMFKTPSDPPHKLEFDVERVNPRKLGQAVGTLEPIFRERISARKPSGIQNLAWLTLRFFGTGEDFVWAASPVINRIRQMTGSNRSDAMFSGVFSPDDLFVWSGKVELVEPSGLTLVPILVPLLEGREIKRDAREGCVIRALTGDGGIALNHQRERFKGAGAWVPTNVVMSRRNVWRMELASRDPFSLDSRQALYIDRDSGLPVYRVVWDDAGRLRRVSIGIIRSLSQEGAPSEPILAGQILISGSGSSRLVMLMESLALCNGYQPGRGLADFDPSTFVRFAAPAKGEKGVEQDKDSEDSSD